MTALCIILGLFALGLLGLLQVRRKTLRGLTGQLRRRDREHSRLRLTLAAPDSSAEELVAEINRLLEEKEGDASRFRAKDQALRQQIANISHDLRTPLTSILGYLQLLEGGTLLSPKERKEALTVIGNRAEVLQGLITSFYDLSRLEGEEYPLQMEAVDLRRSLETLLADFYDELEGAFRRVDLDLAEGLPPVWADPAAVQRVFINLLGNAIRHGTEAFRVRLARQGECLVTSFTNQASGMTREDAAHLFDRSYTADKNRSQGHTGLGLAIVKALAEQMGHRVEAKLEGQELTLSVIWKI